MIGPALKTSRKKPASFPSNWSILYKPAIGDSGLTVFSAAIVAEKFLLIWLYESV